MRGFIGGWNFYVEVGREYYFNKTELSLYFFNIKSKSVGKG